MILARYERLKTIASAEFGDIVIGTQIILGTTGRARKLRFTLVDDTFVDVWYSEDGDYAMSAQKPMSLRAAFLTSPTKPFACFLLR